MVEDSTASGASSRKEGRPGDLFSSSSEPRKLRKSASTSTSQDFSELTLDDWLNKFGRIYGKRHEKHTTEYMISRLVEEVAELVSPMELQDRTLIAPNLADVFSWICSIAYKLNIDLADLTWKKYGTNAPRPSWSKDSVVSLADYSQPATLRDWQEFISKVYQAENARMTPMNALVAMMKDVGDAAMLHRKRASAEQITSKITAILAWTFTIAQLLRLDLAQVVFAKYDDHCPMCLQPVCDTDICHPFASLYASFGDATSDEEKYAVLDTAAKFGLKILVNASIPMQATKDLSLAIELISSSDAACVLLSPLEMAQLKLDVAGAQKLPQYQQIFETLACYSMLSKGNIWVYTKEGAEDFVKYLSAVFGSEGMTVVPYKDPEHLKALFEGNLQELLAKRKKLSKGT